MLTINENVRRVEVSLDTTTSGHVVTIYYGSNNKLETYSLANLGFVAFDTTASYIKLDM